MNRIAIIGSGVMGRVLAINLARTYPNLLIDIYDKTLGYKDSCSYCAGGMLSPISELITCDKHVYELGHSSFDMWSQLENFVKQYVNLPKDFVKQANTYVIAHNQDKHELDMAIRNINLRINALSIELSQKMTQSLEIFSSENISNAEGLCLSTSICSKILKLDEAFIDVADFFKCSDQFFSKNTNIKFLQLTKSQFYSQKQDTDYEHIFDCTGIACNEAENLYGVRGESMIVKNPNIKFTNVIRLLHPRHSIYLIPRGEGIFYVGATNINSEDYSQISVQSALELLSSLITIDKRFAEARIIKTLANVRPVSIDDKPIVKTIKKITYLSGLSRHGYLFAPTVANMVLKTISSL